MVNLCSNSLVVFAAFTNIGNLYLRKLCGAYCLIFLQNYYIYYNAFIIKVKCCCIVKAVILVII